MKPQKNSRFWPYLVVSGVPALDYRYPVFVCLALPCAVLVLALVLCALVGAGGVRPP